MRETQNYKLGLWGVQDEVGREGMNGNFVTLDTALKREAEARAAKDGQLDAQVATKAEMVTGSYAGDGAVSRVIDLGFPPKAVYICNRAGMAGTDVTSSYIYGGLVLPGQPLQRRSNVFAAQLTDRGFQLGSDDGYIRINLEGDQYVYWALKWGTKGTPA